MFYSNEILVSFLEQGRTHVKFKSTWSWADWETDWQRERERERVWDKKSPITGELTEKGVKS